MRLAAAPASFCEDRLAPPRRAPLRASMSSATTSASPAPPQAASTMARSSRRFGAKMPGVSTKTICAAPVDGDAAHERPRRLHLARDDRDLGADERVDQGRLAGVRRADEGDEARRASPAASGARSCSSSVQSLPAASRPRRRPVRRCASSGRCRARRSMPSTATTIRNCGRVVGAGLRDDRVGRRLGRPRPCAHSCSALLGSRKARAAPTSAVRRRRARRGPCAATKPAVEEDGADQGFAGIGEDRPVAPPARLRSRRRRAADAGRHPRRRRPRRSSPCARARDSRRDSSPSGASGKAAKEQIGDGEAEDAVAEELQPLIALRRPGLRRADMGQRLLEQVAVREEVAERRLEVARGSALRRVTAHTGSAGTCGSSASSQGHSQTSRAEASSSTEKKMISARPTKFSNGT